MIAKEGFSYVTIAGGLFLIVFFLPKWFFTILFFSLTVLFIIFFRDPERDIPIEDGIAVSGADGKIVEISEEEIDGEKFKKISVFMNIFNVHVNRVPVDGEVVSVVHKPGKFLSADKKESSFVNEQNIITIQSKYGKVIVKQVAGFVARRTVSYLQPGDKVKLGDRLGIIKFSSRVDHYLPISAKINVDLDDVVYAGETIIARFQVGEEF
ncbi:phosphatidylserine decarboxylase [Calditerrivibrio nitroreducens]|uniref:Phosphatidylserine decarboxylase proenzyme n=1 Tax=Calditerrivibrio nitroreducens (strain DSM 19672 / NBRC 101217 / Yu37-1) TaxID=768670 RepID=E4TF66_CALNY|nr:phosphatidylserine decarboxylase [Calditerrivibrio nitroreducens]ADR18405.1 phosphatidylserine decarboxylase related protein [Calditerrivibrio nitroreducens DSM 19672]